MSIHDFPRDPLNADAARAVSKASGGQIYKEPQNIGLHQKQFMLLISQALARGILAPPEGVKDYRGLERGRMTILTYSHTT